MNDDARQKVAEAMMRNAMPNVRDPQVLRQLGLAGFLQTAFDPRRFQMLTPTQEPYFKGPMNMGDVRHGNGPMMPPAIQQYPQVPAGFMFQRINRGGR